ncbi:MULTISPECIES: hypothetical protein [Amycolatopsis]|uniref:SCO6045-like C-terminal domain-containing protein n=1 Tax=Amycolatopsis thermalba TaxID=944492 RepID=A0ABY4P161_9PSEU|nr:MULTISPECIES: hypothetical protein [Amycolatopsis]OXM67104.1 hypothetical protein CF166_24625 [Amycolatopsis sp. KNN50.9b]UQS26105.1 hypothetical protein L1857_26475 [Amycolatopsis thermalba]
MSREELAARQAELLRALLAGAEPPQGFDAGRVAAEVIALRAKRRSIVANLRPDLCHTLGDRFRPLFDAYAEATPRTDGTGYRQDAANFAAWLTDRGALRRPRRKLFRRG